MNVVDISDSTGEQPLIDNQTQTNYRHWKANSVALYDYLNTFNNVWPSLSVQFFPDKYTPRPNRTQYRLLTTTFTSSQQPAHLQLSSFTMKSSSKEEVELSKYDPMLNEFTTNDPISGRISIDQRVLHNSEINKARMMPQNPDLIATINDLGEVYIFDKTKHSSFASDEFKYEIKCEGHTEEGFGLNWNNNKEGLLITGAMDGVVKIFDLTKFKKDEILNPVISYDSNSQGVNDVEWCAFHDSLFAIGCEDQSVRMLDIRDNPIKQRGKNEKSHSSAVNAISWNKKSQYVLASGDSEGNIMVFDVRNFETPIKQINKAHNGAISSLEFNPNVMSCLASAGMDDNLVKLYDLSKDEDPLVFIHGGHLLGVNDLSWNPHESWMCASVSNDNTVHIWQPSKELLNV